MASDRTRTVHGSAVLTGARAILIRGPSGSGKSWLALALIEAAAEGRFPFARLVGDDRVTIEAAHSRLLVRPAKALEGLIEVRGLGLRRLEYEPLAVLGMVIDLQAADSARLPAPESRLAELEGVTLPRLAIPAGTESLSILFAALRTKEVAY